MSILFVIVGCVLLVGGVYYWASQRKMKTAAYQRRFATLSEAELTRLVDSMKVPLHQHAVPAPATDQAKWRMTGEEGQQVWRYEEIPVRPQSTAEKYHLGLPLSSQEAPEYSLSDAFADAARRGCAFLSRIQVEETGHWANDYGGPMFLLPGLIIAFFVGQRALKNEQKAEMIRYLRGKQNGDGGWGLHILHPSCIFGTSMSYVALRLLGVAADDEACVNGRAFLSKNGGVLGAPGWAKFWLSVLGLYDWSGVAPLTPELWILPRWLPFHPWRWWCHCRQVYLPMSYLYGVKFAVPSTPLIEELRIELYGKGGYDTVDWVSQQFNTCALDAYQPLGPLAKIGFSALWLYEQCPAMPGLQLRKRALDWLIELMEVEDASTNFIDIGPVNKAMNIVCMVHRFGADSTPVDKHFERTADYLWQGHDGMKMQGYNGSQCWDTSFVCQAMAAAMRSCMSSSDVDSASVVERDVKATELSMRKAYRFIDISQVRHNVPNMDYYYRHPSKGAWPFSTRAHGWPISDCTAEAGRAVLACESIGEHTSAPAGQQISDERMEEAIDIILSYQNADDGGFPTYELKRAGEWLEGLNPASAFARIMVDYSYAELTSACVQTICAFRKRNARCAAYRKAEIDASLRRALEFIQIRQRADGSAYGSWAVCFTYGGWFCVEAFCALGQGDCDGVRRAVEFFMGKQNDDGGWGEHWTACLLGEWSGAESAPECTGWALLSLIHAYEHTTDATFRKTLTPSIRRAASWLVKNQRPNGDWTPGPICGMFNGSCTIEYKVYSKAFPIWALAEVKRVLT